MVAQAGAVSVLVNGPTMSKWLFVAFRAPGQVFPAQVLVTASRASRPLPGVTGSVASMAPLLVSDPHSVGTLKFVVVVPPLNVVVRVNCAVLHCAVASVETLKGTELKLAASTARAGYGTL